MELGIGGKFALVTGGSHGIGRAIALSLAHEGCNVAVCSRSKNRLEKVLLELNDMNVECMSIQANAMIKEDINRVTETIINKWGTLHILVNNVGGGGRWGSDDVFETPESVWEDVYNKNALSSIRFTLNVLPFMTKQKWGRVVTISSTYGRRFGGRPWFNISKTAQVVLMKNLSMKREFTRNGITFNTIAPGAIMIPDTGWHDEYIASPDLFQKMVDKEFTLGRLGDPEEIAPLVSFLCSNKAAYINGACIIADGGETSCI